MGTIIGSLADRGYGYAWRVLDAQYFGLAQRRKRVFIVGHAGEPWSAPAEVLLEPESLQGDAPTRRAAGPNPANRPAGGARADGIIAPDVAGTLGGGSGNRGWSDDLDRAGAFIGYPEPARALSAPSNGLRYDFESETLAYSIYPESGQGANLRATEVDVAPALTSTAESASTDRGTRVVQGHVRRLTPLECERLQGFPSGWTSLGEGGKPIADSSRYKMIGNAVAVPCAKWIGSRLSTVMQQVWEDYGADG
jgi:DNA (cytosine-5)-methyltransferase 1